MQKKKKKNAVKCDSDWLCAEISAIPDEHCILSCKLMFKSSFVIIEKCWLTGCL